MSKVFQPVKEDVKCRDCSKITSTLIVICDRSIFAGFCPAHEMSVDPDTPHKCDFFNKVEFKRERDIDFKDLDIEQYLPKEGHDVKNRMFRDYLHSASGSM